MSQRALCETYDRTDLATKTNSVPNNSDNPTWKKPE